MFAALIEAELRQPDCEPVSHGPAGGREVVAEAVVAASDSGRVAVARPVAPLPGRGRKAGFVHSDSVKAKIQLGLSKHQTSQLASSLAVLESVADPGRDRRASEFLSGTFQPGRDVTIVGTDVVHEQRLRHENTESALLRERAVASHCIAQSAGLRDFVACGSSGDAGGRPQWLCSTNVFDDASMWVMRPENYEEKIAKRRRLRRRNRAPDGMTALEFAIAKSTARKGKNVHLPALNIVEKLYASRSDGDVASRAAVVHSPAQILPVANISTVYDRWKTWTASQASGAGVKFGDSLRQAVLQRPVWRHVTLTRDNLGSVWE